MAVKINQSSKPVFVSHELVEEMISAFAPPPLTSNLVVKIDGQWKICTMPYQALAWVSPNIVDVLVVASVVQYTSKPVLNKDAEFLQQFASRGVIMAFEPGLTPLDWIGQAFYQKPRGENLVKCQKDPKYSMVYLRLA